MSSVVCRVAQAMFFAVLAASVALLVAGLDGEARGLLAPMWLLVGMQLGALAYGRRVERGGER